MELSERERQIARCVVRAANQACVELGLKCRYTKTPVDNCWIDDVAVRELMKFFDLYTIVRAGKREAVRHVTGCDPDEFIQKYNFWMDDRPHERFQADEAMRLRIRMKAEMKEVAAEGKKRPRTLYISDCHFYHNRICSEMDRRGFSGYEEMNRHMVRKWNEKVTPKDDVYILGDFSIARAEATAGILDCLNGKLHLIIGNHDRYLEDKHFNRERFRSIGHYEEIRDNGRSVILSHYPIFCYRGQYRKDAQGRPLAYMLYGHVHDTNDERLVHRFIRETAAARVTPRGATGPEAIPCNMVNCFCMFSGYQPLTLDEWIETDRKRRAALDAELGLKI